MIKSISVLGYKSFDPDSPTVINIDTSTDKPVIFFGLNGVGKTAIGEVIDGVGRNDPAFAQCAVVPTHGGPFRYLVYNQAFIDRVIGEPAGMPGIFTLGVADTDTQKKIDQTDAQLKELREAETKLVDQVQTLQGQLDRQFDQFKDRVWEAHTTHASDEPMWTWAQGYHKDKNKFCEKLQATVIGKDEKLDSLEQLDQRWTDADSRESTKTTLSLDLSGFSTLERDEIWNEQIAGSGASRLAALIDQLGNADWVSTGRRYLHGDNCPFCQQELPGDFTDELARLLDGDRQKRIDRLTGLVSDYATQFEALRTAIESAQTEPLVKSEPIFETAWEALRLRLQSNLNAMRGKQEKPRDPIQLEPTTVALTDLNAAIDRVNERIAAFNVRVTDRAAEKDKVKTAFWKFLRRDREEAFVSYETLKKPLEKNLNEYKTKLTKNRADAEKLETQLARLRERRTGVDAAVQTINIKLKSLGVGTFSIGKKPGENNLYCLARPGQKQGDLKSLSEGEKTLISFLYYVVLLNGSETSQMEFPLDKTVAVIDDPISSLSHNFIFDVASILQHEVIKPPQGQPKARQVLVLTHNLFFLHELLKQGNRHSVLLRVLKSPYTSVEPFDADNLLNDYDALWQTLRDARDGKASKQAVPNTMRCILEHFLWFTQRYKEFKSALEELSRQDQNFRPLARFLDRGSHQDATNVSVMDYGQFDVDYYLVKFREVFAVLGFAAHYDSRMAVAP